MRLVVPPSLAVNPARGDPELIKLVVKAHPARAALDMDPSRSTEEVALSQGHARDCFGVLLRLSYLAPDVIAAILDGDEEAAAKCVARLIGLFGVYAKMAAGL